MSIDRLLELLSPYRTFDANGPEELRAAIARSAERERFFAFSAA